MDDVETLRARIPQYADYADTDARHETDKLIRAFLGEAIADARERLKPAGAVAERVDGLLLRCEFSDQRFIRAADHTRFDEGLASRVHALDRAIVECSGRIRAAADADALASELDAAARALDERSGAVFDAPAS